MECVTTSLTFEVPADQARLFAQNLDTLLDQFEPLLEWLARHGGTAIRRTGTECVASGTDLTCPASNSA